MDKIIEISVVSNQTVTAQVTIECAAGQPYQSVMRQLASDRWNFMYPSN